MIKELISGKKWSFKRVGGIFQVELKTVDDLKALGSLDPKLWAALSCPVNDLEIDRTTLKLIDFDDDGRVRIEEMLAAVDWTLARLRKPESLFIGGDLPIEAIKQDDDTGKALFDSALQILENVGDADSLTISVSQSADTKKIYGQTRLNGDGVIGIDATDDDVTKSLISEIIECFGPTTDRSGEPGVSQQMVTQFFTELKTYDQWWTRGEVESAEGADVFPLSDATPGAFEALVKVEKKIDDYFARCQLTAFDSRAESPLNHDVSLYAKIADADFSVHRQEVEQLPLAKISRKITLNLSEGINPEWKLRIDLFRKRVFIPLKLESELLTPDSWKTIKSRFKDYRSWRNAKPTTGVEKLPIARVRELLITPAREDLEQLLAEDRLLAPRMKAVDSVEKLARYHRDLVRILNNFVNFSDFYDVDQTAIFQAGVLYLDGRECRLCLRVKDPAKHAALASLSRAFVVYCECYRKDSSAKFSIAAVVSDGDASNLIVGRNGVFRDSNGLLWDSTIVRIIDNPISIREAFWLPYVRVGKFISSQIEKWAVTRDKAIQTQLETGVTDVASETASTTPSNEKKSGNIGGIAGMIAAGGIALGAVGAGLASLFNTLKALEWWELPIVMLSLVFMVSFPSMLIAWLKLRKRTLAPLLDASGWAVNGRTLISLALGHVLTLKASLPIGANCQFDERIKVRSYVWLALGIAIFASIFGWTLIFL